MKHTTEEYLAWIDEQESSDKLINALRLANRDVLVRHEGKSDETESWCVECGEFKYYFPCPTVLDILQRIAEVM